jgi:hypothetical protein
MATPPILIPAHFTHNNSVLPINAVMIIALTCVIAGYLYDIRRNIVQYPWQLRNNRME